MSVFHQIGHDSINLVNIEVLSNFSGMVCSPINYPESKVIAQIGDSRFTGLSLFDPQLYYPTSTRGHLNEWEYFPNDFDTADHSSYPWWDEMNINLIKTCERLKNSHICSPCNLPARFTLEYYGFFTEIGNMLAKRCSNIGIECLQTTIIDYKSIKEEGEVERIASILSQTDCDKIYLIIESPIEPRREYKDADSIARIMQLIRLLSDVGKTVFVPFCSTDILLWKYAGATMFATGKFFNLRRFTRSRFEDETASGGGQLPYWFEENLLAYIREGDIVRLIRDGVIDTAKLDNPFGREIITQMTTLPGTAWLALSWKKYLYDFMIMDSTMVEKTDIKALLQKAEKSWLDLQDMEFFMEEPRNDGAWVRQWRIAIRTFDKMFDE